jgi:hypothetical protein
MNGPREYGIERGLFIIARLRSLVPYDEPADDADVQDIERDPDAEGHVVEAEVSRDNIAAPQIGGTEARREAVLERAPTISAARGPVLLDQPERLLERRGVAARHRVGRPPQSSAARAGSKPTVRVTAW